MFKSYTHVMRFLDELGLFHMDLTLDRVARALDRLGLTKPPFAVAQVVGTNGKGSTSTFLESVARAQGLKTGLFTSPHFVSPSERIRILGLPLPKNHWPALANKVHAAEAQLTYFEFLTVVAVLAFAEADIELAVIEAGLGGRWDATSAVNADILAITPISMDHMAVLGNTVKAIAEDKSGAMRAEQAVVHAPQTPQVLEVLQQKAQQRGALLHPAPSLAPWATSLQLGLNGPHQRHNAALSLAVWDRLAAKNGWKSCETSTIQGLCTAFIPGRLQSISPQEPHLPPHLILDGAHNEHGLLSLQAALHHLGPPPCAMIFSCLADKDMTHMLPLVQAMSQGAPIFIPTIANNSRAAAGQDLANALGHKAKAVPLLQDALQACVQTVSALSSGPVVLCGSLYLLAEFFTLYPAFLSPPTTREHAF